MTRETINPMDYARRITQALAKGILLNTQDEKFNSMVIGWGTLGRVWSRDVFTVYVRRSRYTKQLLDKTGEFTVSIPLGPIDPEINRVCGSLSGRNMDKASACPMTLIPGRSIRTPAIAQYPLTLECRILYAQEQELAGIPQDILDRMYPQDVDGSHPMANRDPHTCYIGQIVDAYILR